MKQPNPNQTSSILAFATIRAFRHSGAETPWDAYAKDALVFGVMKELCGIDTGCAETKELTKVFEDATLHDDLDAMDRILLWSQGSMV